MTLQVVGVEQLHRSARRQIAIACLNCQHPSRNLGWREPLQACEQFCGKVFDGLNAPHPVDT